MNTIKVGGYFRVIYRKDTKRPPVTIWGRDKNELIAWLNKQRIPFIKVWELPG